VIDVRDDGDVSHVIRGSGHGAPGPGARHSMEWEYESGNA
jgi:hypothetical protein